jgi:autotransporter-associated beta strand protein
MMRSRKYPVVAAAAAVVLATSALKAQTQVYNFETLYDSGNVPDPAGTFPDDFQKNGAGTTVSQSTIGLTDGDTNSMEIVQNSTAGFTGAITQLLPEAIDDVNTVAISADVTIPANENFTGTFVRMGIIQFGTDGTANGGGQEAQTVANSEVNLDIPAGTYHLTIPLIAIFDPVSFNSNVPFSTIFNANNGELMPTSFEFYINKSLTSGYTTYIDNVTAIGPSVNATWSNSTGGSWSNSGFWNGGIPQQPLDTANLNTAIGANSTIDLDGNRAMAALNINSSNQYTIAQGSGGTLTLDAGGSNTSTITVSNGSHTISAPVDFNTSTTVTVNNSGNTLNITGPITGIGGLTVAGNGTLAVSGANSYIGGTTVSSGTLLVGSSQSLPTLNAVVNIASGAKMEIAPNVGGVTLQLPNIATGGILDVGNNHLFIDYGTGTDPISSIQALLKSGYAGNHWNGTGIDSSAAATTSTSYGLGYADSADPGNPAGLPSGTIEIKYTLLGDANLSGVVDGTDFGIVAANFNKGVSSWDQGDFNYDNVVDGTDFGDLASNFNKGASSAASWAALEAFAAANGLLADVPEPTTMSLGLLIGAGVAMRRRRR